MTTLYARWRLFAKKFMKPCRTMQNRFLWYHRRPLVSILGYIVTKLDYSLFRSDHPFVFRDAWLFESSVSFFCSTMQQHLQSYSPANLIWIDNFRVVFQQHIPVTFASLWAACMMLVLVPHLQIKGILLLFLLTVDAWSGHPLSTK